MIKAGVIVAVVLGCLFGIIGFPKFIGGVGIPLSLAQLESNLAHNIHLGLDLKGGSHLVLQVQVQDAAKTEADQTIESLRDAAKTARISRRGLRPQRSRRRCRTPIPSRSTFTASIRRRPSSSAIW